MKDLNTEFCGVVIHGVTRSKIKKLREINSFYSVFKNNMLFLYRYC